MNVPGPVNELSPFQGTPYTYKIAGLLVQSNRLVDMPPDAVGADGSVAVEFLSAPWNCDEAGAAEAGETWHSFAGAWQSGYPMDLPEGAEIWLREDGLALKIYAAYRVSHSEPGQQRGALLKLAVPYASALQFKTVIHAAAVRVGRLALALVGPSGVGKSTLAGRLVNLGCQLLADDLLPCRRKHARVIVPMAEGDDLSLGYIFILDRSSDAVSLEIDRLARDEHMTGLILNGFGELAIPKIWRNQFNLYESLASWIPGFRLILPDDLDSLPESANLLLEAIKEERLP